MYLIIVITFIIEIFGVEFFSEVVLLLCDIEFS